MYLIAGLGNPGPEYSETRHNLGFKVVDRLAAELAVRADRPLMRALTVKTKVNGTDLLLAKPQSYMNRSGEPVAALLHWYKLSPRQLIVVYDDLDLPLGKLRIRPSGGTGGHNGLFSVKEKLSTGDFCRVRLGIGRPPISGSDTVDWVLGRFTSEEQELVNEVVLKASQAIREILLNGLEAAMNKYNSEQLPAKTPGSYEQR